MTKEQQLQKIIDKMVADSTKAQALAEELYGENANLFEESNLLHVMSGDCSGHPAERQKFIKLTAKGYYQVGGGAW
jgi:hypothetical protein